MPATKALDTQAWEPLGATLLDREKKSVPSETPHVGYAGHAAEEGVLRWMKPCQVEVLILQLPAQTPQRLQTLAH